VIFMLLKQADLRDRLLALAGYDRLTLATKALDEAGQRISRYLLMQSIINGSFGCAVGLGLFLIALPHAIVWGVLAAILRFIPYIGAAAATILPVALSLAVFQGWLQPFLIIGLIVGLELVLNVGLEPFLYGQSAGVSTVALLVAVAFWTWLWGPVGLLLSTPLTVCLGVLGKYVPHLHCGASTRGISSDPLPVQAACGPDPPSARSWWDAGGPQGTSQRIGRSSWRPVPMR
jgi:predicted PurR-regulated permease PerM